MRKDSATFKTLSILVFVLVGPMNWTCIFGRSFHGNGTATFSSAPDSSNVKRAGEAMPKTGSSSGARQKLIDDAYARLPLRFEANHGQTDPKVKFITRGRDFGLFLMPTESVLVLNGTDVKPRAARKNGIAKRRRAALRLKLANANPASAVEGVDELPGKSSYFLGKDVTRWRANIPNYSRVQYRDIYPGIDLIYYGNPRGLEFDFVVAPGADYRRIQYDIKGARKVRIDANGDLVLTTALGEVRQQKPVVYQDVDGVKRTVNARYNFSRKRRICFDVGEYDASRPLVIDPVLDYSTFLGGNNSDEGRRIVLDS